LNDTDRFLGDEGTGKSMPFIECFGKILGTNLFAHYQNISDLTGEFNGALTNKLLVLVDECLFAGNSKDSNIVKNFITRDTERVRHMYSNPEYHESFKNFSFLSNSYEWFVAAGTKARRYFVLHSELRELFDYFKKEHFFDDGKYFDWLVAGLQHNDREGLKTCKFFSYY
jgi:hypothetical protein